MACWHLWKKNPKFKNTITTIEFHPSARVLAVGSMDRSFRVYSCYKSHHPENNYEGVFSDIESFNDLLFKVKDHGSWVNSVCFSQCG